MSQLSVIVLSVIALVLGAAPAALAQDSTCSAPAKDPIVHLDMPGRPFEPVISADGCWIFVTLTQQSGNDWLITMKNNTTNGSYNVTVQYSSSNSSAEWVQEAPSVGRGLVSLDQFGTIQFNGASAVRDGKTMSASALGAKAITMINGQGQAIAQPSTIGNDGSSFTIARTDASSSPQSGGGRRRGP